MFSTRSHRSELMDDPDVDPAILRQTLDDLERVNAVLGGYPPSIQGVARLSKGATSVSVLDVGTGGGDIPRRLIPWAEERNLDLSVRGIELSPVAAEHARVRCADFPRIHIEQCDLFEMSGSERFDIVHAALMLHHLDDPQAIEGLQKMYELCRRGVVINDLHRHPLAYFGSRIVLPLLSRNKLIRHDGSLSILRAFRRRELQKLVHRAGLPRPRIRWFPLFRWQMIIAHKEA